MQELVWSWNEGEFLWLNETHPTSENVLRASLGHISQSKDLSGQLVANFWNHQQLQYKHYPTPRMRNTTIPQCHNTTILVGCHRSIPGLSQAAQKAASYKSGLGGPLLTSSIKCCSPDSMLTCFPPLWIVASRKWANCWEKKYIMKYREVLYDLGHVTDELVMDLVLWKIYKVNRLHWT